MTVVVVVVAAVESISAEMDGTGGGEGGTFSLELKSLMNPLFFLTTDFAGAPEVLAKEDALGRVGVFCESALDNPKVLPFKLPLPLAERIRVQLMALCAKPESAVRALGEAAAPDVVAVVVALRERSRACASSREMSLIGMGFGLCGQDGLTTDGDGKSGWL